MWWGCGGDAEVEACIAVTARSGPCGGSGDRLRLKQNCREAKSCHEADLENACFQGYKQTMSIWCVFNMST